MIARDGTTKRAPELVWRAHPLRERLLAGSFTSLLILGLAFAVSLTMESPIWGILSAVVLVLALYRFYFPSSFEIDSDGISARYLFSRKRYEWARVRRFLWDHRGAYLSTRGRSSRMDAFNGLTVLFGTHRAEVMKLIRRHMDEARSS